MMELLEAIENRHSVRAYTDKPIEDEKVKKLTACIETCNRAGRLHMQLVLNEPEAFDSFMAHYGKFSGVKNYIGVVGEKRKDLFESCGYWGEKVVLFAQQLGLNTCWVAMSYSKSKARVSPQKGERLCFAIPIGYGKTQGVPHKSKAYADVVTGGENAPAWFQAGVAAALKAPTAMNQQKFTFSLSGNRVSAKPGSGFYTKADLGIVKCHFEIAAGIENFTWA